MPGVFWVRALSGASLGVSLGLHIFNKPGWWLTAQSRMARDSRCCAGQLQCTQLCMTRCVHSRCFLQYEGFCRCGCSCSWMRCYRCNMWCWMHCLGGRQMCGCSGSYICGVMLVNLDSIWVMLTNVVASTSILSTSDDLDNV